MNSTRYSAEVEMHVTLDNGLQSKIAQLGPDFLILNEDCEFEGRAEIFLSVDGVVQIRDVLLRQGSTLNRKTIAFV